MCTALQIDEETLEKYFKPVKDLQTEVGVMFCITCGMVNCIQYAYGITDNEIVSVARCL